MQVTGCGRTTSSGVMAAGRLSLGVSGCRGIAITFSARIGPGSNLGILVKREV